MPAKRAASPARVRIEPASEAFAEAFVAAVRRSRALHGRWVSPPDTVARFRAFLVRAQVPTFVSYLICTPGDDLVGVVNISEIVRGAFRSAYLGYYAFAPHHGRGLMKEGLALVVSRAFGRHRLHRLEANIQPGNTRSIELVRSLGFEREGYSPRYLKIAGRWRDHERWAITVETWRARRARARAQTRSAPRSARSSRSTDR